MEKKEQLDMSVALLPEANSELWGYQMISINYDARRDLSVKQIIIKSEEGEKPLITDDNPSYDEPGIFEVSLCAECMKTSTISITVEFEGEAQKPITQNYTINHMPIVEVLAEPNEQEVYFDATSSYDPEDLTLTHKWYFNDTVLIGPILKADIEIIQEEPALLEVSDGRTVTYCIVTYDPITGVVTYTSEKLKCTAFEIVTTGKSLLNPEVDLGSVGAENTQLPLDANKKLTKSYAISFGFEIRATIEPHTAVLDEGQDAAGTYNFMASDPTKKIPKKGKIRKEPNRSEYKLAEENTPFPDPLPGPDTHPKMSADNYDHHPTNGFADKNTSTGMQRFMIKAKGLHKEGTKNKMIWFDQPGPRLQAGTDISKGITFKGYFRSWMKPSIPPCQKYFIIEIEIDTNGKVTKNKLTMR